MGRRGDKKYDKSPASESLRYRVKVFCVLCDFCETHSLYVIPLFAHHLLGEKEGDLGEGDIESQND